MACLSIAPIVIEPRDLRRLAREAIPDLLSSGPLPLQVLYSKMAETFPDYCDDMVLCDCTPTARSPEWKHRVRGALQDLRLRRIVEYDNLRRVWRRV